MTSRAAVVGLGRAGSGWDEWTEGDDPPRTHAGCYQRSRSTELVAVCDTDAARATDCANRRGLEASYSSVDYMLRNERPDIVSVCTPPGQHLPVVRAAINRQVPVVLCEKPLANTLEDACEITRLADESDTVVAVMHHRRWMFGLETIRAMLTSGTRVLIRAEYSGGMLNNGTHAIDLVRSFIPGELGPLDDGLSPRQMKISTGGTFTIQESSRFNVAVSASHFWADFPDGGRKIRVVNEEDTMYYPWTDYPNARLRAIEQMADIHRNGGEPNCTVHDGLRAVELAHMSLGRMEVAA